MLRRLIRSRKWENRQMQNKFIQGYSSLNTTGTWCRLGTNESVENKATIFRVDDIVRQPTDIKSSVFDIMETALLDALPSQSVIKFHTEFNLVSAKGKLQSKFRKFKFRNGIDIANGGYRARICVICDPVDVPKAFENGAMIAGSSKMMLDFIYDRPKVDFIFCMENQFDVFKRNDTFQAALNQMKVELPGTMEKTSVIVGDLTMDSETIVENVKIIENEIKSSFRWATGKKGKSAENDKLTFVNARLEIPGMEPFYIDCSNDDLVMH